MKKKKDNVEDKREKKIDLTEMDTLGMLFADVNEDNDDDRDDEGI